METLDNKTQECNVRPIWVRFINWLKSKMTTDVNIMYATEAYSIATYGSNTDKASLIKMHQAQLYKLIRDKINFNYDKNSFGYRCVYSFPDDMIPYIDEVLKPFKDKGYEVINLSTVVSQLKNDHVYLISWYKENI